MDTGYVECSPLSRAEIRSLAWEVRSNLSLDKKPYLDVIAMFEWILPQVFDEFTFEYCGTNEMGENHGLTNVKNKTILIREDVYERACDGRGRDRMTIAHEIGHLMLHSEGRVFMRRGTGEIKAYRDPEWQAKAFAAELLIPSHFANTFGTLIEASRGFGVSTAAAKFQLGTLANEGILTRADLRSALTR